MKKALTLMLIACLFSGFTQAQHKTSIEVKDLSSDIEKFIKTNYPDYQTTEAFKFDILYETVLHKGDTSKYLVFDANGKFVGKKPEIDHPKIGLQSRKTMSLGDVNEAITRHIASQYKGYKLFEAYQYDEIYTAKITKGSNSQTLAFDKSGNFLQKVMPPSPAMANPGGPPHATDSMHHAAHTGTTDPAKK